MFLLTFLPFHYYTTKLEIKPQRWSRWYLFCCYYYTTKLEIKPQLYDLIEYLFQNYYTTKLEIKPQPLMLRTSFRTIIIQQN